MRHPVSNEVDNVSEDNSHGCPPTPHNGLTLMHFDTHTNIHTCINKKINNNSKGQTSKKRLSV